MHSVQTCQNLPFFLLIQSFKPTHIDNGSFDECRTISGHITYILHLETKRDFVFGKVTNQEGLCPLR